MAEKCFVIRAKKRLSLEDADFKIAALEARVAELESRLKIEPKLSSEQVRGKFAELILLIDPRSLQRVLMEINDYDLAGALLDSTEQIKRAIFDACSTNRKKSILSDLECVGSFHNRTKLTYVGGDGLTMGNFERIEIELVDYSTEYKEKILKKIEQLERVGEIVIARGEYGEVFV
jgi:flagellar motor switch protein FliG